MKAYLGLSSPYVVRNELSGCARNFQTKYALSPLEEKKKVKNTLLNSLVEPNQYKVVKGNPNFQGILNWIIQILHYYCRKQHKNIENSRIIEQNVAISLCSSLCLLRLALPSPSSTAGHFQFLETVLNVTSDHSCCI